MLFLILFTTGIFVGLLSTFFGVGGGILAVPVLYSIFPQLPPQVVIACSLSLIFLNSNINTFNFIRSGKTINIPYVLPIALFMVIGVIGGGRLILILPPQTIKLIFATFVLLIAIRSLLSKKTAEIDHQKWKPPTDVKATSLSSLTGFLGGLVAGMTGLGGGAVLVPLFITVLKIPFKLLSFYSNICMAVGTFAGVLTYLLAESSAQYFSSPFFNKLQFGHVNFGIVLSLFLGSLLSSKFGIKLIDKASAHTTKRLFAFLLILISFKTFYGIYFS